MGRAIDLLITYRVIKLLTTPWEKHEAFKFGIIDKKGLVLRKSRELKTQKEKNAYTLLHRFIFNLKRLMEKLPGGKSKIGSYAIAALVFLREEEDNEELKKLLGEVYGKKEEKMGWREIIEKNMITIMLVQNKDNVMLLD